MDEFQGTASSRAKMLAGVADTLREQLEILDREHLLAPAARLSHILDMIEQEIELTRR